MQVTVNVTSNTLISCFSLEPDEDPLGILLMIDFYALKSEQFAFLIRLYDEWEVSSIKSNNLYDYIVRECSVDPSFKRVPWMM